MASIILLTITDHSATVTVTLNDPIGPTNSWTASPAGILSKDAGSWNQLTGSGDLEIRGGHPETTMLTIKEINTYAPAVGMQGSGIHWGSGGAIPENAVVDCTVQSFS